MKGFREAIWRPLSLGAKEQNLNRYQSNFPLGEDDQGYDMRISFDYLVLRTSNSVSNLLILLALGGISYFFVPLFALLSVIFMFIAIEIVNTWAGHT